MHDFDYQSPLIMLFTIETPLSYKTMIMSPLSTIIELNMITLILGGEDTKYFIHLQSHFQPISETHRSQISF